jgi:hypothetical protein
MVYTGANRFAPFLTVCGRIFFPAGLSVNATRARYAHTAF